MPRAAWQQLLAKAPLSFVIINRLGSCGLVRPGVEKESEVAARETVPPSRRLRT